MTTTEQHLTDGEVVSVLDEQLASEDRVRADDHLAMCELCSGRIERQRRRRARLSALLHDTDFAVPAATLPDVQVTDIATVRRRRASRPTLMVRQPWLRIAAGIVLLLGLTVLIPPVQAAVVNWLREQWTRLISDERTQPDEPAPPSVQRGTRVEFASTAREFTIEIAAAQTRGSVTVRRNDSNLARGDTDAPGVELLALPTGLRIVNAPTLAANYEVVVPATASTVTIVIGGRTVARLSASQLVDTHTIPVR